MRAIWNGGIRFGLVYIPVKMYSGVTQHNLDLDMLRAEDGCPIKYTRVCDSDGKEVPWEEIAKGYKMDDHYVILTSEDFEEAAAEKSESLDLFRFVDVGEINPRYFKKSYLLEPAKGGKKTFNLLRRALIESKLDGLCRYVLRRREKIALIRAEGGHIYMVEMHWHQDLRPLDNVDDVSGKVDKDELKMAQNLIDQMKGPFEPEKYTDNYQEKLLKIIKQKDKGKKPKVKKKQKESVSSGDELLDKLKASLEAMKS